MEVGVGVGDQQVTAGEDIMGTQPKVPAGWVREATCYRAHLCSFTTLSSAFTEKALKYTDILLSCLVVFSLKSIFTAQVKVLALMWFCREQPQLFCFLCNHRLWSNAEEYSKIAAHTENLMLLCACVYA